jgi:hypothetical protein
VKNYTGLLEIKAAQTGCATAKTQFDKLIMQVVMHRIWAFARWLDVTSSAEDHYSATVEWE